MIGKVKIFRTGGYDPDKPFQEQHDPTLDLSAVSYEALASELGRRNNGRRKNVTRAGGRPRVADRCECGMFSRVLADKRGHVCATQDVLTRRADRGLKKPLTRR